MLEVDARGSGERTASEPVRARGCGTPFRAPVSTYRLQLHSGFRFGDARGVVAYLSSLGITDGYVSPYFAARAGSTHGYDITDHNTLNPELGSEADYEAFAGELRTRNMGHVLDFVPNHMGIETKSNPWWRDLLENGSCSSSARFFDIDWHPVKPELKEKILLPILGDQYGRVLEGGELRLAFADGQLVLHYVDQELPINPRQAPRVYRHTLDELRAELTDEDPHLREFLSIISALQNMPAYTEREPERIAERQREKEVARERLRRLVADSPRIEQHIEQAVTAFNGEPGRPESFDLLHDLLEAQAYRLSYWRTASHEINYRRFFDINDLAGLRIEDPAVFEATHRLLRRLLAEGRVSGVRVDHPDGLFDPARYFRMVQDMARDARREGGVVEGALYLVAEKILSPGEQLPPHWAVHGTTGYNFLNDLNGLFVDPANARSLRKIYARFTGRQEPFAEVVYRSKKLIMETAMSSELNVLAHALDRLAEANRSSRDFTLNSLRDVLLEVVACFPVYRTYVDEAGWTEADRSTIETAVVRARRLNSAMESSIFDFLREVLLPRRPGPPRVEGEERRSGYPPDDPEAYRARLDFSRRLQQYTGPVQAKGLEDTAFYRYNLLLSLNEVGGDPGTVGRSPANFHQLNAHRLEHWPYEMLSTATHDTKLGEDVRARINVLSELPDDWRRGLSRWVRTNAANHTVIHGEAAPDRNDEYRFYQTLLGAWPAEAADAPLPSRAPDELMTRMRDYMIKAIKEAKIHTSWITENRAYDEATGRFVERALTGPSAARFLAAFLPFQRRIARLGAVNSLAQVVLKVASPGVPDFYRGTDLWDLSLVDPDNRRPVDFELRARLLDELEPLLRPEGHGRPDALAALLEAWPDGRIKLFVTAAGLRLRREVPELFQRGAYVPLEADVTVRSGAVAFARRLDDELVVAVVPRLFTPLIGADQPWPVGANAWKTSRVMLPPELADRTLRNILTGQALRPTVGSEGAWLFLAQVFETLPVALVQALPARG
jgi:(1->4)-alpha-D-glucan 1-alpha-D-glucosylmutase